MQTIGYVILKDKKDRYALRKGNSVAESERGCFRNEWDVQEQE